MEPWCARKELTVAHQPMIVDPPSSFRLSVSQLSPEKQNRATSLRESARFPVYALFDCAWPQYRAPPSACQVLCTNSRSMALNEDSTVLCSDPADGQRWHCSQGFGRAPARSSNDPVCPTGWFRSNRAGRPWWPDLLSSRSRIKHLGSRREPTGRMIPWLSPREDDPL